MSTLLDRRKLAISNSDSLDRWAICFEGRPLPKVLPNSDVYYTDEEVLAEIKRVKPVDRGRYLHVAKRFTRGTQFEPDDFVNEAIALTLGGERRWKRGVELYWHLWTTMRSMRSSEYKHRRVVQAHHSKIFGPINRLGEALLKLGGLGNSTNDNPDPHAIVYGAQRLRGILNSDRFDEVDRKIVISWMHGREKSELITELGLSSREYDKRKRIIHGQINKRREP